jgi:hypothetical protein
MGFDSEIRQAICAHAAWKDTLSAAVSTQRSLVTVETVGRDDHCRLGRWLHGLDEPTKASHRWKCVAEVHARFHNQAAAVLALALAGETEAAREAMSYSSKFSGTSAKLTRELQAWQMEEAGAPRQRAVLV